MSGPVPYFKSDPQLEWYEYLFYFIVIAGCIFLAWREDDKYNRKLRNDGVKTVLSDAHERAISATDTVNIKNYIDPKIAARDSARYAKRITNTIKHSGSTLLTIDNQLKPTGDGYYIRETNLDPTKVQAVPDLSKYLDNYEHAIVQLELYRRRTNGK